MPAMPGPTRKYKILCEFFQKRAIELQAAGITIVVSAPHDTTFQAGESHRILAAILMTSAPGIAAGLRRTYIRQGRKLTKEFME